ncbi:MAG TPA: hypothetical protein VFT47_04955 [Vicinamibacterales bacterium]|nr:hypothetical protein [Vicinamibacterales bacterium]
MRFGYRRLLVLLRREGWDVGQQRLYRVYTEEGLALRRKRPWRHATAVHGEQRRRWTQRNDIWSMDFVADELADGRRAWRSTLAMASAGGTWSRRSGGCASNEDYRGGSTATTARSS